MLIEDPAKNRKGRRPLRVYAETSVFGGYFDKEFSEVTRKFFEEIKAGKFILIISVTTLGELDRAPVQVLELVRDLPGERVEMIDLTDEMMALRDSYIRAKVVGPGSRLDAEHIACATVAGADLIVSWNFRHIVHYEKIRGYQAVNIFQGYPAIPIHSPREVIEP
jgi:hypothetical protein